MSEMVERLMDLLWARGVTVTVSDVEATIAAMRESTLEMVKAAWNADENPGAIWEAMIDAALENTPRAKVAGYYADPDVGPAVKE